MEYSVKVYSENDKVKSYILNIKENDKGIMYLFWVPQSGMSSRVIDVYFDNERCILKEGKVGLSLNGNRDINVLVSGINVFRQIMKVNENNMSFCFIPFNEEERKLSINLGTLLKVIYTIDDSNYRKVIERNIDNGIKIEENTLDNNNDRVVYLEGNEIRDAVSDALIGIVNQDGFSVNWENNSIENNGRFVGFIGDKSFKVQEDNSQGKANARVKMPGYAVQASRMSGAISHEPSGPIRRRDAAFVSLPVIMFVLSAMMLIGSIILLFVLD